jgi:hypothetical protein
MIKNHNHRKKNIITLWKNHKHIVKNINQVISPLHVTNRNKRCYLIVSEFAFIYIINQKTSRFMYIKFFKNMKFSPRLIYNSLFVKLPKTTVTKNRMNNVMYITLLVGLYK